MKNFRKVKELAPNDFRWVKKDTRHNDNLISEPSVDKICKLS